jgi:hypothetical protein
MTGRAGGQSVFGRRTYLPGVDTDRWQGEAVAVGCWPLVKRTAGYCALAAWT